MCRIDSPDEKDQPENPSETIVLDEKEVAESWEQEEKHEGILNCYLNETLAKLGQTDISDKVVEMAMLGALYKTRATVTNSQIGQTFLKLHVELEKITAEECIVCASADLHESGFCSPLTRSEYFAIVFNKLDSKWIKSYRENLRIQTELKLEHLKDQHRKIMSSLCTEISRLPLDKSSDFGSLALKMVEYSDAQKVEFAQVKTSLEKKDTEEFQTTMSNRDMLMTTYKTRLAHKDEMSPKF